MSPRAGFVWSERQHFNRYIEDLGIASELITPQMLAAPFFRIALSCLIIPTGFANPAYSNILPALRASSSRIAQFVENGGKLRGFGAAMDRADAYDWLPFSGRYAHDYRPRCVVCSPVTGCGSIIEDYDATSIECDGSFPSHEADCVGSADGAPVILAKGLGKGMVVITSVHEFPSKKFLQHFCSGNGPVRF
jgi:hypothetical protein